MRHRWARLALAAMVLATTAGPAAGQDPSAPAAQPSEGATPVPVASPVPAGLVPIPDWVPRDIAADVDAIRIATTTEEAVAATRTLLERAGVVVTDDPSTVAPTAAAVYLTPAELEAIALETLDGPGSVRTTYDRFAVTFGGAAGLTADEATLERLGQLDMGIGPGASPGASPAAGAGGSPVPGTPPAGPALGDQLDVSTLPGRMTAFLNGWVALALEQHGATEPELRALIDAPLALAVLASVRPEALDLRTPFAPADLRLGMLEVTLLTAGMRGSLAWARAGILETATTPALRSVSWRVPRAAAPVEADQSFSDCDQLKRLIDTHVPISTAIGIQGKRFIKTMIQGFLDNLFGAASNLSRAVGPAFTALGLMFKVAALVMLYEETRAELRLEPAFVHKPADQPIIAAAELEAGIPDAKWEAARRQRQDDFWSTALRTCARLLGIPVTRDLIDVADAMKDWVVRWEITSGLDRHVRLHEGEMSGPGVVASRLERPLARIDDHTSGDTLAIDVLPEAPENHPGTEYSDPVQVCARVVPREPPGGFKTFLSAGFAGQSLAGSNPVSGLVSLAGIIGDLLVAWYRELGTIDACATMNVSYHVPQPGAWRGRIRVNWESRRESMNSRAITEGWGTGPHGEPGKELFTTRVHDDITDTQFVGGDEDPSQPGSVELSGRSYVHGIENFFDYHFYEGFSASCQYQQETVFESLAGGWTYEGDARGALQLSSDGSYTIDVAGASGPREITMPTRMTDETRILGGVEGCQAQSFSEESEGYPLFTGVRTDRIEGVIDPADPGTTLKGSKRVEWPDGSVTTITWDLVHDGPIRLP